MIGDLNDAGALAAAIESADPEIVVHLAAEIASQRDPKRIEETNVGGTQRLIDACEAAGVRRIVFTSTVVTGDAGGAVLDEETALPVETAYGRSKQEGERLLRECSIETSSSARATSTGPAAGSPRSSSAGCASRVASP